MAEKNPTTDEDEITTDDDQFDPHNASGCLKARRRVRACGHNGHAVPMDIVTPIMHTVPPEDESEAGCREQASPFTTEPTATQEHTQHNSEERTIE